MLYTAYDLPQALDYCHQLLTEFDQVACSGGVFMENQSSSFGLHTKWLSTKNLLYPCNSKHVKRQRQALLLPARHLAHPPVRRRRLGQDGRLVPAQRARAGSTYCFQSYGRDVAGAAVRDPAQMKDLCGMAGSGEKECIYGAIRDVMNNNPQDPQGEAFCKVVKADVQGLLLLRDGNDPRARSKPTRPASARPASSGPRKRPTSSQCLPAPAPRQLGTSRTTRVPSGVMFRIRPDGYRSASSTAFCCHRSRLMKSANGGSGPNRS